MNPKLVYYIIQLLEGLGMGSFFPIYTPWLELNGLNFLKMGAVNFFYHIASTMLDPFTGFIADKFGKRKSFVVGQIFWTATQYIYGASTNIGGFLWAEGIAAVGHSMKSDALESWLQNKLGEEESSRVMGKARTFFTVGQICTAILASYISDKFGMPVAWFASGTFFLIATILGSAALYMAGDDLTEQVAQTGNKVEIDHREEVQENEHVSLKQIFTLTMKNKTIVSAGVIVTLYSFASKPIFIYWPQIVEDLGVPNSSRGWSILAMAIPAMFGSLLAGRNLFYSRNEAGLANILGTLCVGLIVTAFAKSLEVFFAGLILIEIAYGALNIVLYGHLYQEIQIQHRSTVNSIISATRTLGGAFSLLFMGEIADLFSPQVSLGVGGILMLFVWVYYVRTKIKK